MGDATGVVMETAAVVITTAGVAAQAVEEPQAPEDNLATSATAMTIFGVRAQNCCASASRRRDTTTSSIARAWRTR